MATQWDGLETIDLAWRAHTTNDPYGIVSATLQLAFALKDAGHQDEAVELFASVRNVAAFRRHEQLPALSALELGVGDAPKPTEQG